MTMAQVLALFWLTVTNPRAAAVNVLGLGLRGEALWLAGALVVIAFPLSYAPEALLMGKTDPMIQITGSPILGLLVIAGQLLGTIIAVWAACRLLGAQVSVEDLGALFIWIQGLQVLVQLMASLLVAIGQPAVGGMLTTALFVLAFWISAQFIDVLTGFNNLLKSFGAYLLGALLLGAVLMIVFAVLGISPVEVLTNV